MTSNSKEKCDVWFEGFVLLNKCMKCEKNMPDYFFVGQPRTFPEVTILVCKDCFDKTGMNEDKRFVLSPSEYIDFNDKSKNRRLS
jgi:hypothetical protein